MRARSRSVYGRHSQWLARGGRAAVWWLGGLSVLLALCVLPARVSAEPAGSEAASEVPEATGAGPVRAPVTVDGHVVFLVRGVSGFPAERRAREIGERIAALAADPTVSPESLQSVDDGHWTRILAGDKPVMAVVDADAVVEGVSRWTLAEVLRGSVQRAIVEHRRERSPEVVTRHALYAAGATAAVLVVLWLLLRAFRVLDRTVQRRFRKRLEGLEEQSFRLIQARQLWAVIEGVVRGLRVVAVVALVYAYVHLTLELFPWTRPLSRQLWAIFVDPLRTLGVGALRAVPNLVFVAVVVAITRYVLHAAGLFFTGIEHGSIRLANFDREWAQPTYRIVRVLVIAFALVVSYPYIPGSGSEAFKGISIFLGVVFSLGSSSVMASIMAGYAMTYRRAFRVGDRVKIADVVGDVLEVRLMVTRLRTLKNEEVVIPNSAIQNEMVINYSALARERGLILHTTVGIGYETPWRQVEAMLLLAAERTPGLLRQPPPFVLQKALGDFAVTYELNVYSDQPQASMQLYTELHRNILDAFNEYGVQIMTPAYEGDPEQAKVVSKEQWFAAPAPTPSPRTPQPQPEPKPQPEPPASP